jgi:tetratricopeptide (TPR) repeat protein
VLDDVVERGTVNLKFVWDEASDVEKWCLAALAHRVDKADARDVGEYLSRQRVRCDSSGLERALLHLKEKDVLTSDNHFVIHLMRLWLQKNRPIERVREELTEVNPIASRFVEIGLEFKDRGLHDKALENFQQALNVDRDNLQARVNMGLVQLEKGSPDQAVAEFEKALAIDDQDVRARAGLCTAHLALGDVAAEKGKTDEAAQSYKRVLAINSEHTEARQRMADIQRQRAEKALAEGRDEEALAAFRQALDFTPEDAALEARFREVQAQKRAAVLNALRDRAEQALRQQRWEQALAALEEAMPLDPEGPDLRAQLALARAGLEESQRKAARDRANGFEKAERWDEALHAWAEYAALKPVDQETTQAAIARVEKARSMAQLYAQAQEALAKKDYDRAVSLLKAIVLEDEAYKNASRLMTEAIEARRTRRRFWPGLRLRERACGAVRAILALVRRAKETPAVRLGFAIGLGLVVVAGASLAVIGYLRGNGQSPGPAGLARMRPTETVPSTSAPALSATPNPALVLAATGTPTASATPTLGPTRTATALPEWVTGFAQPILETIASRSPDFQDDFDQNTGWKKTENSGCRELEISKDGELILQNCTVYREHVDYPDIVAEFDGRFLPESTSEGAHWAVQIRKVEFGHGYRLHVWYDGRVDLYGLESGELSFSDAANPGVQSNHVLLIAKGTRLAFYINGHPLIYAEDDRNRWGTIMFELPTGSEYTFGQPVAVALDNFKLWDISDIAIP